MLGTADPARHGQDPRPKPRSVIGCNLSRAFLDLHARPDGRPRRAENAGDAIAAWAEPLAPDTLVVLEATAGCDAPPMVARGISLARVNPRQACEFARAIGVIAKTDRLDTRVPAGVGTRLSLPVTTRPARARLGDVLRRRRRLVEMRKAERTGRHGAGQEEIAADMAAMIDLRTGRITALGRAIAALIAEDRDLAAQAQRRAAVPGIGPIVLARPPSRRTARARHAWSLAHRLPRRLAPEARESGLWRGACHIRGRRRNVREALLIAARTASRRIPALLAMPDRMRADGKAPETVLVAVARQLLVILNALPRNGIPLGA